MIEVDDRQQEPHGRRDPALLDKYNGKLGDRNSVARMFTRRAHLRREAKADEETLMAIVLEAGADDMQDDGDYCEVLTSPDGFHNGARGGRGQGHRDRIGGRRNGPRNLRDAHGKEAAQMVKLMEALEDHDDVQHVWSNADIEEKEIEASLA